jgi:hypothetical protein
VTSVPGSIVFGALTFEAQPVPAPSYLILEGTGPGAMTRRRDVVTSPWVDGETEVASVRGAATYTVVVQCVGTSWSNACVLADAVLAQADLRLLGRRPERHASRAGSAHQRPPDRDPHHPREKDQLMPYTNAAKAIMLSELAGQTTHLSIHTSTGSPSTTGANEATGGSPAYARKVPAFGTVSGGVLPLSTSVTFDLPAGTYRYVGMWASTTFLGYGQLPIDRVLAGQDTLVVSSFSPNLNL